MKECIRNLNVRQYYLMWNKVVGSDSDDESNRQQTPSTLLSNGNDAIGKEQPNAWLQVVGSTSSTVQPMTEGHRNDSPHSLQPAEALAVPTTIKSTHKQEDSKRKLPIPSMIPTHQTGIDNASSMQQSKRVWKAPKRPDDDVPTPSPSKKLVVGHNDWPIGGGVKMGWVLISRSHEKNCKPPHFFHCWMIDIYARDIINHLHVSLAKHWSVEKQAKTLNTVATRDDMALTSGGIGGRRLWRWLPGWAAAWQLPHNLTAHPYVHVPGEMAQSGQLVGVRLPVKMWVNPSWVQWRPRMAWNDFPAATPIVDQKQMAVPPVKVAGSPKMVQAYLAMAGKGRHLVAWRTMAILADGPKLGHSWPL
ncbi:hypothetical protein BKA82DRAFT_4019004 [Pisolithus tinctorius]|nr:hypothetical protein BKA82DRAFT_4019004 [Pisolithus tinctorius]